MVQVFCTTVKSREDVIKIKPFLDKQLTPASWNFDLSDCDHILRVVASEDLSQKVISVLQQYGYSCRELE
ncbi:MAG: hypothetical protein KGO92_09370 [Bacteroidota bacterium]|nr:hypothetical protein [Bacteroidota bacterium]